MMRSHSHVNTVKAIIRSYDGSTPLSVWLKQFFKSDKKFGSRDRKEISHACYCYYRLGNSFLDSEIEERILIALFLCSPTSNKILEELRPVWNERVSLSLPEKIDQLFASDEIKNIFPFANELSSEIEIAPFHLSFLIQPDLFLRIRPGKKEKVVQQIKNAGIEYELPDDFCIRLSNQTKVEEIVSPDEDAVVQDLNSQKVFDLFNNSKLLPIAIGTNFKLVIWDCCAASGGKSILLYDRFPQVHLTVTDVRESILINLQKRFKRAGIKNYVHFVADISSPDFSINKKFDAVICDAPCSGSGTWSRTPEQLYLFKNEKIEYYSDLQKRIAVNAAGAVKPNGFFLYITCSVFKKENEEVVNFIQHNSGLQLKAMQYFKGYDKKADTLFVALFSMQ